MARMKIDILEKLLSDCNYEADAVSMGHKSLFELIENYQQKFEVDVVTSFDVAHYLDVKILIDNEKKGGSEFSLFRKIKS